MAGERHHHHQQHDRTAFGSRKGSELTPEALNEQPRSRAGGARRASLDKGLNRRGDPAVRDDGGRAGVDGVVSLANIHFDSPAPASSTLSTMPSNTYRSVVSVNGAPVFITRPR